MSKRIIVSKVKVQSLPYAKTPTVLAAIAAVKAAGIKVVLDDPILIANAARILLRRTRYAHKSADERAAYVRSIGKAQYEKNVGIAKKHLAACIAAAKLDNEAQARRIGRATGTFTPTKSEHYQAALRAK